MIFYTYFGSKTTFCAKIDFFGYFGKTSAFLLFPHNQSVKLYDFGVLLKIMLSLTV